MTEIGRALVPASFETSHGVTITTPIRGLTKQIRVSCKITADQWELYGGVGRDDVASELNCAFESAVNNGLSHREVSREVWRIMLRYQNHGATDSEPMGMLDRMLSEVFSLD